MGGLVDDTQTAGTGIDAGQPLVYTPQRKESRTVQGYLDVVRAHLEVVQGYLGVVRAYLEVVQGYWEVVQGYLEVVQGYLEVIRGYLEGVQGYLGAVRKPPTLHLRAQSPNRS